MLTSSSFSTGLMRQAFDWIHTHSLCTYTQYPYTSEIGISGMCHTTCTGVVTVTNHTDLLSEKEMFSGERELCCVFH